MGYWMCGRARMPTALTRKWLHMISSYQIHTSAIQKKILPLTDEGLTTMSDLVHEGTEFFSPMTGGLYVESWRVVCSRILTPRCAARFDLLYSPLFLDLIQDGWNDPCRGKLCEGERGSFEWLEWETHPQADLDKNKSFGMKDYWCRRGVQEQRAISQWHSGDWWSERREMRNVFLDPNPAKRSLQPLI